MKDKALAHHNKLLAKLNLPTYKRATPIRKMKKILDGLKGQYVSTLLTLSIPVFILTDNGKIGFIVACLASLALFIEGTIQNPPNNPSAESNSSELDNWIAGWRPRTPPSEESNSSETEEAIEKQ